MSARLHIVLPCAIALLSLVQVLHVLGWFGLPDSARLRPGRCVWIIISTRVRWFPNPYDCIGLVRFKSLVS
jgi:hypothetical protein